MSKNNGDKTSDEKINDLWILFTDDNFGFAKIITRHDKTLYGNGLPGLVFQTFALWLCVFLLALDNPTVRTLVCAVLGR